MQKSPAAGYAACAPVVSVPAALVVAAKSTDHSAAASVGTPPAAFPKASVAPGCTRVAGPPVAVGPAAVCSTEAVPVAIAFEFADCAPVAIALAAYVAAPDAVALAACVPPPSVSPPAPTHTICGGDPTADDDGSDAAAGALAPSVSLAAPTPTIHDAVATVVAGLFAADDFAMAAVTNALWDWCDEQERSERMQSARIAADCCHSSPLNVQVLC